MARPGLAPMLREAGASAVMAASIAFSQDPDIFGVSWEEPA